MLNGLSATSQSKGLFVFTRDLRVNDNRALLTLASQVGSLTCVYVLEPTSVRYQCVSRGAIANMYLKQSLFELDQALQELGQRLVVIEGEFEQSVLDTAQQINATHIGLSAPYGFDEQQQVARLTRQCQLRDIDIHSVWQHTIFDQQQLPVPLNELEGSFSRFRGKVEKAKLRVRAVTSVPSLPPQAEFKANVTANEPLDLDNISEVAKVWLSRAGCRQGQHHLKDYFTSKQPQTYKLTRNALDEWASSTKLSPWLAWGEISVVEALHALKQHEAEFGSNDSTYWIKFELLWREYFHWQMERVGRELFFYAGVSNKPITAQRHTNQLFNAWCHGNTDFPLINAIMKQLNQTGFISNRARQIAASCWVHECEGDWRLGAAYFQQQLVDYDVAANWGNWQYVAGVGFDPKGGRRFDIGKQTRLYDPQGHYIQRWAPECAMTAKSTNDGQMSLSF